MVTISEHAWRAEGSRTFVQVGTQIPADILIKGMIVQSGNDATIALAERVGGTEAAFAQMMNEYAKRLGMNGSNFENSDGLPSPNHYTTARDVAMLAAALIREFPQYYPLFSLREFIWNNIHQENRNGLLGGPDRRRPEDRPHRQRRLLPGDLGEAQRHAPDLGGDGLPEHQGARGRERGAAQLRLHLLRDRAASRRRREIGAQAARLQVRRASSPRSACPPTSTPPSRAARRGSLKTATDLNSEPLIAPLRRRQAGGRVHGDGCRGHGDRPRAARAARRRAARRAVDAHASTPSRCGSTNSRRAEAMAEPLPICYLNGAFLPLREARISPLDRGFLYADGVYEVMPVYGGRPFRFAAHLERLGRSLAGMQHGAIRTAPRRVARDPRQRSSSATAAATSTCTGR